MNTIGKQQLPKPVRPWFLRSGLRLFAVLFTILTIPTIILTLLVTIYVRNEVKQQSAFQNTLTARLIADSLNAEFYGLRKYVEDFARRTKVIEGTVKRDQQMLRIKLAEAVALNARFNRAFIVDAEGNILTDYPYNKSLDGMNFAHRDWFRGASSQKTAYISEIYRRTNVDRTNSITVAVRIENEGTTVGYLGAQFTTDQLLNWLKQIDPSQTTSVLLLDQHNQPLLSNADKTVPSISKSADWQRAVAFTERSSLITDEETGRVHLVGVQAVPTSGWKIVAIQSMEKVFQPVRALLKTIGIIFVLCFAGTAIVGFQWYKTISQHEESQDRAARELETQAMDLKRSNDELQAVCYSIAHDLRGPLRGVRGLAIALKEDYADSLDDTGKDYVKRLDGAAERMDALTRDLLDYGRLSHLDIKLENVSLEQVVEKVLTSRIEEIKAKGAQVEIKRPLPSVKGTPVVLEQALANLLDNALKFMGADVIPCIRIGAEQNGSRVTLRIRDNGIGIDPAHQQRIFGVFERLHKADVYPGTGIGLALVRRGIERLGGHVGVESKVGQGSCFWIELAAVEAPRVDVRKTPFQIVKAKVSQP